MSSTVDGNRGPGGRLPRENYRNHILLDFSQRTHPASRLLALDSQAGWRAHGALFLGVSSEGECYFAGVIVRQCE